MAAWLIELEFPMRRNLLTLLGTLLLAACTGLAQLDAPQLAIIGVRFLGTQQNQQQFVLTISVRNPNMRQLAVRGIDYGVSLAGEEFANGTTVEPFTVPALGEASFDLNVSADLDKAVRVAAQRMLSGELPWRVSGRVRLAQGALRNLPFTSSGNLSLR
jgi:LEA14-like dessication related protein